ncbi:hypothetical protein [Cryobacterium sp. TMT1-66-1]|uniref:hypothetical protein n=1 Tax=Cryobacterium sp. TMT1-66-1 TaxID=1259242 RepID=UPI00106BEC55|nr:hypothetical protein [Cryobacterium sp. TMT1-66-1]TFD05970.1 hypothetical protein E3T29_11795 [Cryobacterium sp. TMT1-66-1]
MDHSHPNNIFIKAGGVEVEKPPLVVDGDNTLSGTHNGSVCVHDGTLTIVRGATHNGSLTVQPSAHVAIHGVHNGSLTIGSSATSEVLGAQNGSVRGGTVTKIGG